MTDNKPQGKDDPEGWTNGDVEDLRDPRGGTYGEIAPTGTPDELIAQPRTPHQNAQPGADVRGESVVVSNELPEGLKHERQGPMNKTTGRRPAD
jgi:hypothetical protein